MTPKPDAEQAAYAAFARAFEQAYGRFKAMPTHRMVARIVDICAFVDVDPDKTELGDALDRAARHGSIEAAAAMMAIGMPEKRVTDAMLELVKRSPDLNAGTITNALLGMAEEMFEAEVTAGRMTRSTGPDGKPRYRKVE